MEKSAFTKIYQSLYPLLFRYIFRLCRNEESTKDICQETFLKFYLETSKGEQIKFEKSWIFKCATNDFLNRNKRAKIIAFEPLSNKDETIDILDPEDKFIHKEKIKNLEKAINKLSEKERQLIYLYQEDFSYAEISNICEIKATSVGTTLSRIISKVSTHLHKTKCYELL